ncbi:unnamed protein product [Arctogadus glacialis]
MAWYSRLNANIHTTPAVGFSVCCRKNSRIVRNAVVVILIVDPFVTRFRFTISMFVHQEGSLFGEVGGGGGD